MNKFNLSPFGWGLVVGCIFAAIQVERRWFEFEGVYLNLFSAVLSGAFGAIIGLAFAHAVNAKKERSDD